MSFNYTFDTTPIQPESVKFESDMILRPLQQLSDIDRLMPFKILPNLDDLTTDIFELTGRRLPEYVADFTDPENNKTGSTKSEIHVHGIQDKLQWSRPEFNRQMRDPANMQAELDQLTDGFSTKRTTIADTGSNEPSVAGWASATRATLSGQTTLDTTSADGWVDLVADLEAKMRSEMNQSSLYNSAPKWIRMTNDAYTNATKVKFDSGLLVIDWLESKYPLVGFSNGLNGSLDKFGNIATNGVQTIMLGTNSPQTGMIFQTPFARQDVSRHAQEVRFWYQQKFVPVTLRKSGFIYQTGLTV